jgi:hypothetical protein
MAAKAVPNTKLVKEMMYKYTVNNDLADYLSFFLDCGKNFLVFDIGYELI